MIANTKRRHRPRGAKGRFVRARRRNPVNPVNRRRPWHRGHETKRRNRRRSGGGFGAGMPSFLTGGFLRDAGFGALGAVAPTLVTDRILPLVGLTLTGFTRRIVQLAVPTAVLWLGGSRFVLGKGGMHAFAIGAYSVTLLGLVNDFTGGIAQIGGQPALGNGGMGAFERVTPGLGAWEDAAAMEYAQ